MRPLDLILKALLLGLLRKFALLPQLILFLFVLIRLQFAHFILVFVLKLLRDWLLVEIELLDSLHVYLPLFLRIFSILLYLSLLPSFSPEIVFKLVFLFG